MPLHGGGTARMVAEECEEIEVRRDADERAARPGLALPGVPRSLYAVPI